MDGTSLPTLMPPIESHPPPRLHDRRLDGCVGTRQAVPQSSVLGSKHQV